MANPNMNDANIKAYYYNTYVPDVRCCIECKGNQESMKSTRYKIFFDGATWPSGHEVCSERCVMAYLVKWYPSISRKDITIQQGS